MAEIIKVIIVDDHDLFREGLSELLKKAGNIEVIGQARNGKEFIEMAVNLHADIVITDIQMPDIDGVEATRQVLRKNPDLKVLVLSMYGDDENYFRMIQAGVKGYILKTAVVNDLIMAITEIVSGGTYFSNELLRKILSKINDQKKKSEADDKVLSSLTKREIEILRLIAEGRSNEEIVKLLNISLATVKSHRSSLLGKTTCSNSASLVMFAVKNRLVEVD